MSLLRVFVCIKFTIEKQFHLNTHIDCHSNTTLFQVQKEIENKLHLFDNRDYSWHVDVQTSVDDLFKYKQTSISTLLSLYCKNAETLRLILIKRPNTANKSLQFNTVDQEYQSTIQELKTDLNKSNSYEMLDVRKKQKLETVLKNIFDCSCGVCNYHHFIARDEKLERFKNLDVTQLWLNWGWTCHQNEQEQRDMMMTILQASPYQHILMGLPLSQTEWHLEGYKCCYRVFTRGYGLSLQYIPNLFNRVDKNMHRLKKKNWNTINLNICKKRSHIFIKPSPKRDLCDKFWLRWLALMGEWSPDFERVVIPLQRKMDLFEIDFAQYAFNCGWNLWLNPISYSYFVLCLCRVSQNISVRWKDKRRFTQCRWCGDMVDCLVNAETVTQQEHAHLLKGAHLEEIRNIRYYVLAKEAESRQCPWKSALIIADSMDQSCLNLPNEYRKRKSCTDKDPVFAFKVWLTSLISTFQPYNNFFWKTSQTTKGGAMMVTLILFWLMHCVFHLCFGVFWPQKLFIVVDNGPENKSYNFILFLHVLVWFGIFETIELIYFPVGHTHWKVDQQFSIIRQWITKSIRGLKVLSALLKYLFFFDKDKIAKVLKSKNWWLQIQKNEFDYNIDGNNNDNYNNNNNNNWKSNNNNNIGKCNNNNNYNNNNNNNCNSNNNNNCNNNNNNNCKSNNNNNISKRNNINNYNNNSNNNCNINDDNNCQSNNDNNCNNSNKYNHNKNCNNNNHNNNDFSKDKINNSKKDSNHVQWLQKIYDWENIVHLIRRDNNECLELEKNMSPGIKSYNNFVISKHFNNVTKNWQIRTECFKFSVNNQEWERLKMNKTLWFCCNKITKIGTSYLRKLKNDKLLYMHQVMCEMLTKTVNPTVCYTNWPTMHYLENMEATPMEGLKPMNFEKIREYMGNFNLEKEEVNEWENQLLECEELEKTCCNVCMKYKNLIKESLKEAKYKDKTDSAPTLKKKYQSQLKQHLVEVNYHCNANDPVQKKDRKYHLFKNIRIIKQKIQKHLKKKISDATQDDSNMSFSLFSEYDKYKVSTADQVSIDNNILQKCAMFSGSFAKMLEALELDKEFTKVTNINIHNDFKLVSTAVKQQFISAMSKPSNQKVFTGLQDAFWNHELNDLINSDNCFDYFDVNEWNWKKENPHVILLIQNNLSRKFNSHPWLLFYVLDHPYDEATKKRHYLGQWLDPLECYSLKHAWTFQKIDIKSDPQLQNIHMWGQSMFNKCPKRSRHNGMKNVRENIFIDCLGNYFTENDNQHFLFHRPLQHLQDFTITKNLTITFSNEYINELQDAMTEKIESLMIDDYCLFAKNDHNNKAILNHNVGINFKKFFCDNRGPQSISFVPDNNINNLSLGSPTNF